MGIVLFCLMLVVSIGYFFQSSTRQLSSLGGCAITFGMAHAALEAYANEHDGMLPPADKWQDEVRPYYAKLAEKMTTEFREGGVPQFIKPSDADANWQCVADGASPTGIAFNSDLGGKKLADIKNPDTTPMLFEVPDPGPNRNLPYAPQPKDKVPRMFGRARDWLVFNVNDDSVRNLGESSSTVNFNINPDDAKLETKPAEEPKALETQPDSGAKTTEKSS